jgi:hypothetical protein
MSICEPGDIVFRHACKLGLEGIVSKRVGSPVRPLARLAQMQEAGCASGEGEFEEDLARRRWG